MLDQPALVLKRELVDIPLWGWVAGVMASSRSTARAAPRRCGG